MRFALIGEHPDGLDMARALAESGRHDLVVYCGPPLGGELLQRWNLFPEKIGDMEEALAAANLDAVIVAGNATDRANQLRRALQSEHHVLCVHPADQSADIAYEAEMIRKDTGKLLFPLLPEALHPGIARLAELVRADTGSVQVTLRPTEAPALVLIEIERHAREQILIDAEDVENKAGLPCWDILRALGGEIGELMAFAETEYAAADRPILTCGRFVNGGLFQERLLPRQAEARLTIAVRTHCRRFQLDFPLGFPAESRLTWTDDAGNEQEATWPDWNPWAALVGAFERLTQAKRKRPAAVRHTAGSLEPGLEESVTSEAPLRVAAVEEFGWRKVTWKDEVRSLELDAAARRSLEYRRANTLDFQEVTEAATFKGTMTLVGCGLLWLSLALLIFSVWFPWLGWIILPLFAGFLLSQGFRVLLTHDVKKTDPS